VWHVGQHDVAPVWVRQVQGARCKVQGARCKVQGARFKGRIFLMCLEEFGDWAIGGFGFGFGFGFGLRYDGRGLEPFGQEGAEGGEHGGLGLGLGAGFKGWW